MAKKARVLIVDDEASVADALEIILADNGYDITVAMTGRDGLLEINDHNFDVTITDLRLPDMSGLEVLSHVREKDPAALVIVITAHSTPEVVVESKRLGAYEVLSKPFLPLDVLTLISAGLEKELLLKSQETITLLSSFESRGVEE